jgi:hypothetical protein
LDRSEKIKLLARALGEYVLVERKQELVFRCPRKECKGKEKLCVSLVTGEFHCWVCHWKGRTYLPLLRKRVSHEELEKYASSIGAGADKKDAEEFERPALPEGFELIEMSRSPSSFEARAYLRSRGISVERSMHFKLGVTDMPPFQRRIIIPSFDAQGALNFVTSRKFDKWHKGPKYLHGGRYDKDIVFNELLVDWEQPVVVVEGPFDSFKVENCIPLQGNSLRRGSRLLGRLVEHGTEVKLALDQDTGDQTPRIAGMLASFDISVSIVPLFRNKDFGSMAPDQIQRAIESAQRANTEADMLRARIGL